MSPSEIKKALTAYANSDLKKAHREGEIACTDTKLGTLFIRYNPHVKTYSISTSGMNGRTVFDGALGGARKFLIEHYDVVVEY